MREVSQTMTVDSDLWGRQSKSQLRADRGEINLRLGDTWFHIWFIHPVHSPVVRHVASTSSSTCTMRICLLLQTLTCRCRRGHTAPVSFTASEVAPLLSMGSCSFIAAPAAMASACSASASLCSTLEKLPESPLSLEALRSRLVPQP